VIESSGYPRGLVMRFASTEELDSQVTEPGTPEQVSHVRVDE
jgi:hypothetical protein